MSIRDSPVLWRSHLSTIKNTTAMTQQGQQVLVSSRSLPTLTRKDDVSQCVLLAFHEVPADAPVRQLHLLCDGIRNDREHSQTWGAAHHSRLCLTLRRDKSPSTAFESLGVFTHSHADQNAWAVQPNYMIIILLSSIRTTGNISLIKTHRQEAHRKTLCFGGGHEARW